MNQRIKGLALAGVLMAGLAGCDNIFGLDNYDEPESELTGRLAYNGQAVGVRTGGIVLDLFQPGYELTNEIDVTVDQDGTFSASVFDGDYEISLPPGTYPWVTTPSRIPVSVRGNATIDIPVTPYYQILGEQVTKTAGGAAGNIQATFNIGQVNTTRLLEFVGLYVGTTSFVDPTNRVVQITRTRANIGDLTQPVTLSVALPANIAVTSSPEPRTHVYARVGVKTVGVTELLYSPVIKIAL